VAPRVFDLPSLLLSLSFFILFNSFSYAARACFFFPPSLVARTTPALAGNDAVLSSPIVPFWSLDVPLSRLGPNKSGPSVSFVRFFPDTTPQSRRGRGSPSSISPFPRHPKYSCGQPTVHTLHGLPSVWEPVLLCPSVDFFGISPPPRKLFTTRTDYVFLIGVTQQIKTSALFTLYFPLCNTPPTLRYWICLSFVPDLLLFSLLFPFFMRILQFNHVKRGLARDFFLHGGDAGEAKSPKLAFAVVRICIVQLEPEAPRFMGRFSFCAFLSSSSCRIF